MIPLPDLAAYLYVEGQPDQDSTLVAVEDAAVSTVERETGRYFGAPEEVTEVVRSNPHFLRDYPAGPVVVEVKYGDEWVTSTYWTQDGMRLDLESVRWGWSTYRARYTRGYLPAQEPPDVRMLVMQLAAHYFENRIGAPLPDDIRRGMARWRRMVA